MEIPMTEHNKSIIQGVHTTWNHLLKKNIWNAGKSKHHDPEPYKVIAGMNMLGSAELQLYHGQKLFQSIVLPQGSIYIMHGDATFPMKHAVGAPVGGRRVAAVARFVERGSIWGLYEGSMFYP